MRCPPLALTPLLALALSLAVAPQAHAVTLFTAHMDESQGVPPPQNGAGATGSAILTLNDAQTELSYVIDIMGLDFLNVLTPLVLTDEISNLHIHFAPAGFTGDVVFGIVAPSQDNDDFTFSYPGAGGVRFEGAWDAPDELFGAEPLASHLGNLFAAHLYLNAHTPVNPGGEIRGQIVPEPGSLVLTGLGLLALARGRAAVVPKGRGRAIP